MQRVIRVSVAVALAAGLAGCGGSPAPGPVRYPGSLVYFPEANVGDVFTDGTVQLLVDKGVGVPVIDAVRSLNTSPGLRVLGVLAAGKRRRWGFNEMVEGFPPKQSGFGPLTPAVGATVTPGSLGTELLIGYQVTATGYQARGAVEVDYHIGSARYALKVPVGIANCPRSIDYHACDAQFSRENP